MTDKQMADTGGAVYQPISIGAGGYETNRDELREKIQNNIARRRVQVVDMPAPAGTAVPKEPAAEEDDEEPEEREERRAESGGDGRGASDEQQADDEEITDEYRKRYGIPQHFKTHGQLNKALRTMERELGRRTNALNTVVRDNEEIKKTLAELKELVSKRGDDAVVPDELLANIAAKAAEGDQKGMAAELKRFVKELTEKLKPAQQAGVSGEADEDAVRLAKLEAEERMFMAKHGYTGDREREWFDTVVPGMKEVYEEMCEEAGVDRLDITLGALYAIWKARQSDAEQARQTVRTKRAAAAVVTGTHRAPGGGDDAAASRIRSARSIDELEAITRSLGIAR